MRSDNVAVETSLRASCTTYAPLVTIRDEHASALDSAVQQVLQEHGLAAIDNLRQLRQTVPVAKLYIRHGLMVGGHAHARAQRP